jgi:S1-C subfamily serine protease
MSRFRSALIAPAVTALAGFALVTAACSGRDGAAPAVTPSPETSSPTATASGTPTNVSLQTELSVTEVVDRAGPSVVRIASDSGVGSGFIVSPDGYVLTNNHVVRGASTVSVTLADGAEYTGEVVGTDEASDLALIKIDASDLPALEFADLDDVDLGETVVAIGYALDLEQGEGASYSVTTGIVSQKNRAIAEAGILGAVQTDAAINHGNSGGPLLNLQGQVVGVNTALQPDPSTGTAAQGIGYAVGADMAKAVYEQLLDGGSVARGLLGIRDFEALRPATARDLGIPEETEGVYLPPAAASVDPSGPAAAAGIQPGDVIVSIEGETIANEGDLAVAMIRSGPGDEVDVDLYRDGQPLSLSVTLGTGVSG